MKKVLGITTFLLLTQNGLGNKNKNETYVDLPTESYEDISTTYVPPSMDETQYPDPISYDMPLPVDQDGYPVEPSHDYP